MVLTLVRLLAENGRAGACGWYSKDSDLVVGLPNEFYKDLASVSPYCGEFVVVEGKDNKTITALVADASSLNETMTLSIGAWDALDGKATGLNTVQWRFANATESAAAKKALESGSSSSAPAPSSTSTYVAPSSSSPAAKAAVKTTSAAPEKPSTTSTWEAPKSSSTSTWEEKKQTTTTWAKPTTTWAPKPTTTWKRKSVASAPPSQLADPSSLRSHHHLDSSQDHHHDVGGS